jgi:hypothetical protein
MHRLADLFVSEAASLPDILRIPGSLDVIFRPWGFSRQRNSIAADPLTGRAGSMAPPRWRMILYQGAPGAH